jgi:hypothetical protein
VGGIATIIASPTTVGEALEECEACAVGDVWGARLQHAKQCPKYIPF